MSWIQLQQRNTTDIVYGIAEVDVTWLLRTFHSLNKSLIRSNPTSSRVCLTSLALRHQPCSISTLGIHTKRALHIIFNLIRGSPYLTILSVAGLNLTDDTTYLGHSFKPFPNLIPASITSSHLSVTRLSFLGYGPLLVTLAHSHALKIPVIH